MKLDIKKKAIELKSQMQFDLKKKSPDILIAVGFIGIGVTIINACIVTKNELNPVIEESHKEIEDVHERKDLCSNAVYRKDLTLAYGKNAYNYAKLYRFPIFMGLFSSACIMKSYDILKKRNLYTAAALYSTEEAFRFYRQNVVDRFGEKVDEELKYGGKIETIKHTVVDEDGKEKTVKEDVMVVSPDNRPSQYAIKFDQNCANWSPSPDYRRMYVKQMEEYANRVFNSRGEKNGYLFLNEAIDLIDDEQRKKSGQVAGWYKKNPNDDGRIKFNLVQTFVRDEDDPDRIYEEDWIDFNVDGNILQDVWDDNVE